MNESYVYSIDNHRKADNEGDRVQRLRLTSDWKTTESPLLLQCLRFSYGGLGRKHNRVQDEAVLESLDFSDHLCLILGRTVMMYDSQSTE